MYVVVRLVHGPPGRKIKMWARTVFEFVQRRQQDGHHRPTWNMELLMAHYLYLVLPIDGTINGTKAVLQREISCRVTSAKKLEDWWYATQRVSKKMIDKN